MAYLKTFFFIFVSLVMFSCGTQEKQKLYIYNWTDYISPGLIRKFEDENNCTIVYDTYDSNENMLTKVMHTQASYDIVFPSGDHVVFMIQKKLIEKLNKSKIPNYKNLSKSIMNKVSEYDSGAQYSIPYFWGTTGLIYNKRYIPEEKMQNVSWNILADKSLNNKNVVTMLDDARSVVGAALIYSGYSLNDMTPEALAKAKTALLEWDKNVSQYDSDSYKNEIQDGTTWLAQAYNGDALQVISQNEDVGFVLPAEGAELWIDSFVILKNAENKDLAYKFIDFMLDAENAKENADYVQYAVPNDAAFALLDEETKNDTIKYPSDNYLKKCSILKNVGEGITELNKIWEEIRNN